jgi:hypothetical protein
MRFADYLTQENKVENYIQVVIIFFLILLILRISIEVYNQLENNQSIQATSILDIIVYLGFIFWGVIVLTV